MAHLIWAAWVDINTPVPLQEATNKKGIPFLQRGGIFLWAVEKLRLLANEISLI